MVPRVKHILPLLPFMVDKSAAAELCSMSVATYDKYARRGLLPAMNATGRVSVEAVRQACWKLDGVVGRSASDESEAALSAWEAEHGQH